MRRATPTPAIAGESNRGVPREFIDQKAEQQLQHLSGFYKPVARDVSSKAFWTVIFQSSATDPGPGMVIVASGSDAAFSS